MIRYMLPKECPDRTRKGFSAIDVDLAIDDLNIAEIMLTEPYPESGLALNEVSTMLVRVLEGYTTFKSADEEIFLGPGAYVLVEAGKPYAWRPRAKVKLLVISSPPWTPEQHKAVGG